MALNWSYRNAFRIALVQLVVSSGEYLPFHRMCDHGFFTNTIRTSQASRTSNTAYAWVGTNPNDEARLSDISPVATVTKQSPYLCAFTNLCHVRCFWKLLSSKWNPSGILCCKIVHLPVQKKKKQKDQQQHGNEIHMGTGEHGNMPCRRGTNTLVWFVWFLPPSQRIQINAGIWTWKIITTMYFHVCFFNDRYPQFIFGSGVRTQHSSTAISFPTNW